MKMSLFQKQEMQRLHAAMNGDDSPYSPKPEGKLWGISNEGDNLVFGNKDRITFCWSDEERKQLATALAFEYVNIPTFDPWDMGERAMLRRDAVMFGYLQQLKENPSAVLNSQEQKDMRLLYLCTVSETPVYAHWVSNYDKLGLSFFHKGRDTHSFLAGFRFDNLILETCKVILKL
jgi:hypothetical protein